jgi:hypothetical protein
VKSSHPEFKEKQIRKHLLKQAKYKHLSDGSLRRLVAAAFGRQKNRYLEYLKPGSIADPLQIVIRDVLVQLGGSESSPNLEGWVKACTDATREVLLKPDREQVDKKPACAISSQIHPRP